MFRLFDRSAGDKPFFILGCARSGTTLLRDLLRLHPRLECPEETHFFRWADPFASPRYNRALKNRVLRSHRSQDGIDAETFSEIKTAAMNRRDLADA